MNGEYIFFQRKTKGTAKGRRPELRVRIMSQ